MLESVALNRCVVSMRLFAQADSLVGANTCASAALCTSVGVDRILFAFRDSARRTLVNTCTASDAVVTNYVSHNDYKNKIVNNVIVLFFYWSPRRVGPFLLQRYTLFFIYKLFVGFLHVFISIFNKIKTLRLFRLSVFLLLLRSRKSIRLLWKKC